MGAIFLSASVPVVGRGSCYASANPFLIECAVRELVTVVIGDRPIVLREDPMISSMVQRTCREMDVVYQESVILYQSRFFDDCIPIDYEHYKCL